MFDEASSQKTTALFEKGSAQHFEQPETALRELLKRGDAQIGKRVEFFRWFVTFLSLLFQMKAQAELPEAIDSDQVAALHAFGKRQNFSEKENIVLIETSASCPIVRKYIPTIRKIISEFKNKNVDFYLVNSTPEGLSPKATKGSVDFGLEITTLIDSDQSIAKLFGFKMSSQAIIYSVSRKQIIYRGAIDDSVNFQGSKPVKKTYLKDALESALRFELPKVMSSRAFGCAITFKK